jgi:hypothetical protein
MDKYQIPLPIPSQGINLIDDSLIADNEAAEGTKNISFKNGIPHTRPGYVKGSPFNFITQPHTLFNYMRNSVRYLLAACGTTLKRQSEDTFIDIEGALNSDVVGCLTYPCMLGQYTAPYNVVCNSIGTLAAGTYAYKITAFTASGESLPSSEVSVTLTAMGGVMLSWTNVGGASGYKIYGRASGGLKLIYTIDNSDTVTFFDDGSINPTVAIPAGSAGVTTPSGLTCTASTGNLAAGDYSYRVTTLTTSGESMVSMPVSIKLSSTGGVKIKWDKMFGSTGYKVYGRTTGNELYIATIDNPDTVEYTDDGSKTPAGALPSGNTTAPLPFSDKCFVLDGANYRYYDGDTQLRDVPVYNPNDDEITAYGTNVLITTPDEIKKQRFIVNDDERLWVAGYGKLVRISHLQRPDYFPSTQVWKLEEDCTGMARFMDEIMLFTENTATLVSGSTPNFALSDHYVYKKLPGNYGCSNHRSIALGYNAIYWANKSGIYRYRYLPTGYSIPECVSEFILPDGRKRSIKKWIDSISDWSKVHAEFYDHEYRLFIGSKKVIVFDSISSTWALYEYDKDFACSMVYDNRLYYSADYLYHMDYPYDPYGPTYDGLNDDGVSIAQDLKSKFFDFGKAANKKKFKELYFTIYTELISYNIGLLLNMDNEYETISEEIVNTVARMGELRFGDRMNFRETNLNYPVKIHHKGKKYNMQYELSLDQLNMAFTLMSVVLSLKIKELK